VTRPEAVRLVPGTGARVLEVEPRGATTRVRVRLGSGQELEAVTTAISVPAPGDEVAVEIDPSGVVEVPARPAG
jgi:hypothetical protein